MQRITTTIISGRRFISGQPQTESRYQKVIVALKETIRLMTEIDDLIPRWPVE